MEVLHIMPGWFLSLNIFFECLFLIFAIAIATYSFRVYRITRQRESRLFGLAFSFLAISHIALVVINTMFLSIIQGGLRALEFEQITGIKNITVFSFFSFLLLGVLTLVYLSLRLKSARAYILLLALSVISLAGCVDKSSMLYLIISLFLLFIGSNYITEFRKNRNKNTFFVMLGFISLFIGNVLFLIVANYLLPGAYVVAYIFEVLGYILIFFSLVNVFKNGKKKK